MEAQTDITTYLEQGRQALARGQGREAAIAFANAAQLEPENPLVHLGLAEANLALGSYPVVMMACRKTQELAHTGPLYHLAQALLDLLDRRYPSALEHVDNAIADDPGNAYAHALRAYLLRATGQTYDAGLARSRASRLSIGGTFENCFPPLEPVYTNGYQNQPTSFTPPLKEQPAPEPAPRPEESPYARQQQQQEQQIPPWGQAQGRRQMVRARFWLHQHPRFVTAFLIGINAAVYLLTALLSQNITPGLNVLVNLGGQVNILVTQGQFWRLFTAMFLHFNIFHIGLNMLSLFFIGSSVELFYGKWRYLLIYLLSGIAGGLAMYLALGPNDASTLSAGASGAIFGVFGALGAFYIVNRRALGPVANAMIGQWVFWLVLNLAYGFYDTGIAWQDHIGGLVAGLVLGLIFLPPLRRTGRRIS